MYRVFLSGTSADDVYEILPKSYQFTDELNDQSTARVTVGLGELIALATKHNTTWRAMLTAGARELYITKDDVKIFWGLVSGLDMRPLEAGGADVDIKAISWFGVLGKFVTGIPKETHATGDIGDLAWTLIDDAQQQDSDGGGGFYSDLGITQGASPAISNHQKTYSFDNLKDAIIGFSKRKIDDGYDFDIDMSKQFNVYTSKGSDRTGIVFDDRLILDWKLKIPLVSELCNRVYVVGEGINDDVAYELRQASTALRDAWYSLTDVQSERDVSEAATLQSRGDQHLADLQEPVDALEIKVDENLHAWTDYDVGDTIYVTLQQLALAQVGKRVVKRIFLVNQERSAPTITLTLE